MENTAMDAAAAVAAALPAAAGKSDRYSREAVSGTGVSRHCMCRKRLSCILDSIVQGKSISGILCESLFCIMIKAQDDSLSFIHGRLSLRVTS